MTEHYIGDFNLDEGEDIPPKEPAMSTDHPITRLTASLARIGRDEAARQAAREAAPRRLLIEKYIRLADGSQVRLQDATKSELEAAIDAARVELASEQEALAELEGELERRDLEDRPRTG